MAHVEIAYCAGWSPQADGIVGVITPEAARARDAAGEPYSMAVTIDGHLRGVVDVDWGHHYVGKLEFDRQGRRTVHWDYRRVEPDRCRLVRFERWRYDSDEQPEFDPYAYYEAVEVRDAQGNAYARRVWRNGTSPVYDGSTTVDPARVWLSVADIVGLLDPDSDSHHVIEIREPDSPAVEVPPPWQAPRPHGPGQLTQALAAGTRWVETGLDIEHVTEALDGGVLRLPTGRVVVAECGSLSAAPYTVEVPPGKYQVTVLMIRDHQDGYDFYAGLGAVRLEIRDEPVTSWEMAVRPGEDVRTLPDGHWYGFPVDGGTGTFYDAAASDIAAETELIMLPFEQNTWRTWRLHDPPGAPANLFLFASTRGDGRYPVWIGRTKAGEVACFVADMLLLSSATDVTPGPAPEPLPEAGYRRSEPP